MLPTEDLFVYVVPGTAASERGRPPDPLAVGGLRAVPGHARCPAA